MMDRREFLKSLAGFGLGLAIHGISLETATSAEIDRVWKALEEELVTFHVSEGGTITNPDVPVPVSRGDLFLMGPLPTSKDLLFEAERCYPMRGFLAELYISRKIAALEKEIDELYALDPAELEEDEVLKDWISSADQLEFEEIRKAAEEWLQEDYDSWDCEYARHDVGPQGSAYDFFDSVNFDLDEIGVVIVEGDRPGSDYVAAELRWEIEEANKAAKRLGIPIQFV